MSQSFRNLAIIGFGLIGSSVARAVREKIPDLTIVAYDQSESVRARVQELGLADKVCGTPGEAVADADLVMIAVPVGNYQSVGRAIRDFLKPGTIVSDVGSVKQSVMEDLAPLLPENVSFIPGHPIAGRELSGPDAGLAKLFVNRWCILTPPPEADAEAVGRVQAFWQSLGAKVEVMDAKQHDMTLAITSHLPHLIAYTIVKTATDLGSDLQAEVIRYSAGGFRDFTRLAASDPVMWRDIFLRNKQSVLDLLLRYNRDLFTMQNAIRLGDGDLLQDIFTCARKVRQEIIEQGQAEDPAAK